eukprot:3893426-Rhodomonas_salina.1
MAGVAQHARVRTPHSELAPLPAAAASPPDAADALARRSGGTMRYVSPGHRLARAYADSGDCLYTAWLWAPAALLLHASATAAAAAPAPVPVPLSSTPHSTLSGA